ncbi:MAG: zf-HC2 domain-containing protein [Acidobacteria bacterium]|nr:MAG: zf-HC2 domain-containing protein [Acidobacteriota bacterium]
MKSEITCKDCVDLLMDYIDHSLDPGTYSRLDDHLHSCPPCIHFLKSYRKCSELSGQLKDQRVQIPLELENRLKGFLKAEIAKPEPPASKH